MLFDSGCRPVGSNLRLGGGGWKSILVITFVKGLGEEPVVERGDGAHTFPSSNELQVLTSCWNLLSYTFLFVTNSQFFPQIIGGGGWSLPSPPPLPMNLGWYSKTISNRIDFLKNESWQPPPLAVCLRRQSQTSFPLLLPYCRNEVLNVVAHRKELYKDEDA